jgi:hypothetical protein
VWVGVLRRVVLLSALAYAVAAPAASGVQIDECVGYIHGAGEVRGDIHSAHDDAFIGRYTGHRTPIKPGVVRYRFRVERSIRGRFPRIADLALKCVPGIPGRHGRRLGVIVDHRSRRILAFVLPSVLVRGARPLPRRLSRQPTRFLQTVWAPGPKPEGQQVLVGLDLHGRPTAYRNLGLEWLSYDGACPGGRRILIGTHYDMRVALSSDLRTIPQDPLLVAGRCAEPSGRTLVWEYETRFRESIRNVLRLFGRVSRPLTRNLSTYATAAGLVYFVTTVHPRTLSVADARTGLVHRLVRMPVDLHDLTVSADGRRLLAFDQPLGTTSGSRRLVTYDTVTGETHVGPDLTDGAASWVEGLVCWASRHFRCLTRSLRSTLQFSGLSGSLISVVGANYLLSPTGGIYELDSALHPHLQGFTPEPLTGIDALDIQ